MFKSDKLTVLVEREEDVFVLRLIGELTTLASFDFNKYIEKIIPTINETVVVDLSKCDFISSSGISSFFYLYRMVQNKGLDLRITAPSQTLYKIFQTVNLDKLVKIEGVQG